ncbi:MAG: alkaline phosphatase family protein [Acidimicrobiales bacterium]
MHGSATDIETPAVVMVGFDAMDPGLARELAERGEMPNLKRLFDEAANAVVRNPVGFVVGGVWPSFITATPPSVHGRHCYAQLRPGSYDVVDVSPLGIEGKPWWQPLMEAGGRVCNVDIPFTIPRPDLGGVQIVDWGTHDRCLDFVTVPEAEAHRILDRFGAHVTPGMCDAVIARGRWAELRDQLLTGPATRTDIVLDQLARADFDLVQVVHAESHCVGHQFWKVHDPDYVDHDPQLRAHLGDPLVDVYRALDTELGRLLEATAGALVFVLLSHGMGPHHDGDHLVPEILRRLDQGASEQSGTEHLSRVVQRAKAAVRPLVPGRLLDRYYVRRRNSETVKAQAAQNRARSRFFHHVNNTMYSGIRLNLAGREPQGRVMTHEVDDTIAMLTEQFEALVEHGTGRHVVNRVIRVSDIYEGPHLVDLPDLLVDWNRDEPIGDVSSPSVGRVLSHYVGQRSGDHRLDGRIFVTGPGADSVGLGDEIDCLEVGPMIASRVLERLGVDDGDREPA